jgi:hypothetical protein
LLSLAEGDRRCFAGADGGVSLPLGRERDASTPWGGETPEIKNRIKIMIKTEQPEKPDTPYLRRRDVRSWLDEYSPTLFAQFEKLVDAGAIQRIRIGERSRGYYLTQEIEGKILRPFREAEERVRQEG